MPSTVEENLPIVSVSSPENFGYYNVESATRSAIAEKLVRDCLAIRPGENVVVETWNHGLDFAREFAFHITKAGGNPLMLLEDEQNFWRKAGELPTSKLGKVGEHEWAVLKNADAYIFIPGPAEEERYDNISDKVSEALTAYNDEWYVRASKYRIRGLRFGLGYLNRSRAKKLGIDFDEWVKEEVKALDVDYRAIEATGRKIASILKRSKKIKVSHPNGTNLELAMVRDPILDTGIMKSKYDPLTGYKYGMLTNLPSGSVLDVPKADSTKGAIKFNLPSPTDDGKDTADVSLEFGDNGLLSSYSGGANFKENFEAKYVKAKKPDSGRAALFSIGLNPNQHTGYRYDDSAEGVILFGIGHYNYGDKNKTSFRFYGVLEGGTVTADGKDIVRDGKIVL